MTLLLVLGAFYKTGGFFQPLLALARTLGCVGVLREVTVIDHVLVYWVGPSLGSLLAIYIHNNIASSLLSRISHTTGPCLANMENI